MSTHFDLRPFFKPLQPTADAAKDVYYQEILPKGELAKYIYCYWQLKTEAPLEQNFDYRVVTDGCVDIIYEVSKPKDIFIMGFSTSYKSFNLDNTFNYCGVRFFPMAFPILFSVSADTLTNSFRELSIVYPRLGTALNETLIRAMDFKEICAGFQQTIAPYHHQGISFDQRVYEALVAILKHKGNIDIAQDLKTGLSPRQMRRLFKYYVGCAPKIFSKVIRFQQILGAKPSTTSLRNNPIFHDAGYYDQAHFIKEFKKFFGTTPGEAFPS